MTLDWLPDETVFSFCSRYRIIAGHRLSAETALDLFSHARLGTAHDFPCRLERFSTRFDGRLGDSESIARDHTILPFFFPFQSEDRASSAIATLRGDKAGSLKYFLGLLTTGFRAAHPLKACPLCLEEDLHDLAAQPWRIRHQLPGAWACTHHRVPLLVSRMKINQTSRFLYLAPSEAELRSWWADTTLMDSTTEASLALAGVVGDLLAAGTAGQHFSAATAARVFQAAMIVKGFAKTSGRIDTNAASEDFRRFCEPLLSLPDMRPLPKTVNEAGRWIGRVIHQPRTGTHPLRFAIPITWLFGSFRIFVERYEHSTTNLPVAPFHDNDDINLESDHRQTDFFEFLHAGQSVRSAAANAGMSTQTGLGLAAENGVPIRRRPSKLKADVLKRFSLLAKRGLPKSKIEETLSISRPTLDRLLRCTPGLAVEYAAAIELNKRNWSRAAWSRLRMQHPTLGTNSLRVLAGDLYAWLYRHDREWLTEHRPTKTNTAIVSARVDWDARDAEISLKVQRAALDFSIERPGRRMQLRHLKEHVHELSPMLTKLERMPLTEQAIETALRRRARFRNTVSGGTSELSGT